MDMIGQKCARSMQGRPELFSARIPVGDPGGKLNCGPRAMVGPAEEMCHSLLADRYSPPPDMFGMTTVLATRKVPGL
jgi:hypothetical protein|eukprot:COSAG01_NODE_3895_length_5574_cov_17.445297_4_plen_77_part_00